MPRPRRVSTTVRARFSSMRSRLCRQPVHQWFSGRMSEEQQSQPSDAWVPGTGSPMVPQYGGGQPLAPGTGPLGKVRGTGACMGLTIITLGIYTLYWFFQVHEEMKRHTGRGLG